MGVSMSRLYRYMSSEIFVICYQLIEPLKLESIIERLWMQKLLLRLLHYSLAVRATIENALLNNLTERELAVSLGSLDALGKLLMHNKVDFLFCNILAPTIKKLAPGFSLVTSSESRLFLSGILVDQVDDITNFLVSLNWEFHAVYKLDKWALIELCRNPQ